MEFSLSTSWNAAKHNNAHSLLSEIRGAGFTSIELGFSLSKKIVEGILEIKDAAGISISSLHNMCPLPPEIEPRKASPDYYALSSLDEGTRRMAVESARNTIDHANMLGAKAVVLHIGRVPVTDKTRLLAGTAGFPERFYLLRKEMIAERGEESPPYLENAIKSISEIIPYSKSRGVSLGIENRYYYSEIPIPCELETIFKIFNKDDIFYWHDTGHAEVAERLGLSSHKDVLKTFSNYLLGIHLHDIINILDDHLPPGTGSLDFSMIKPSLKKDTIKVIEAHQPATADDIRKSAAYLSKLFG